MNGPGAYYLCNTGELFENKEAQFFLNHPAMTWVKTNGLYAASVRGAIPVKNTVGTMYLGRIDVTSGKQTWKQIGKVNEDKIFYLNSDNKEVTSTGEFEVLACQNF